MKSVDFDEGKQGRYQKPVEHFHLGPKKKKLNEDW
jgi:hypothetical protein